MLPPIATPAEAALLGFDASDEALMRASIRVRGFTQQQVTAGSSTISVYGRDVFQLPQRPVTSVDSVAVNGTTTSDYRLVNNTLTIDGVGLSDDVTVAYSHGYSDIPDELIELVCQIATRLDTSSTQQGQAVAAGVQQQTAGSFSIGFGWDAWKAQADLTAGEKATLRRLWPSLPRTISTGRP